MTIKQFTKHLSKNTSSIFSPTSPREPTPPRDESKGKGIAAEEPLKEIMPFIEEGGLVPKMAQAQKMAEYEAKRKKMFDQLPITKITYRVNSSKEATMRITRGNYPLILTIYERFRLKTLGYSEWLEVLSQEKALGFPPPPELSTFRVSIDDKKRKRSSKRLKQV
nr:hypothetical protein [Tanacetum cinerariifolium]